MKLENLIQIVKNDSPKDSKDVVHDREIAAELEKENK